MNSAAFLFAGIGRLGVQDTEDEINIPLLGARSPEEQLAAARAVRLSFWRR